MLTPDTIDISPLEPLTLLPLIISTEPDDPTLEEPLDTRTDPLSSEESDVDDEPK